MKQFEAFRLDTVNECLWLEGAQLALRPKPFAVLRYLVENPGRLITHDELLDALWPETYVQPQVLRTYMLELRKVLGDEAGHSRFIQTLPKRGYCFVAEVTESAEAGQNGRAKRGSDKPEKAGSLATSAFEAVESDAEIVGRGEELARLKARLDLLGSGQRQAVFVTGEAGIGKTALVDAFCRLVVADGAASVARGQSVEGVGHTEDYYPVMEALGQLCASEDGERACRVFARMAPSWLGALGREERTETAALPMNADRMLGELCGALEELAAEKPLMLVFEDLHWADEATVQLISALARRRAAARLMVLGTYRPQALVKEHPLRALKQDLLMRKLCEEIALAPLVKTAVKELLIRELRQEVLPVGLASFVHQHSEGNPLFVIAIVEHLTAQRFLVRAGDEGALWEQRAPFTEMEASVPDGLSQMIELEMERLTADEQRLLEAGSVMSVAFPAWAVAAALQMDPAEAEEACDELASRLYFVERVGEDELPDGMRSAFYVFAHGLYREVLYQRQTASRRARRHVRIAERLGEMFAGREADVAREMALHFEAAGAWQRAAGALRVAACHAQYRKAYAEAVQLLEHALRIAENLCTAEQCLVIEQIRGALAMVQAVASENSVIAISECVKNILTKA